MKIIPSKLDINTVEGVLGNVNDDPSDDFTVNGVDYSATADLPKFFNLYK